MQFFEAKDFSPEKKVYSSALWVTLTYDTKLSSRIEAWEGQIGSAFNRFISALRRKYGKISVLRTWEASEKGYPHVHAILLFHDAQFSVFPHFSMKQGTFSFRIYEKGEISSY